MTRPTLFRVITALLITSGIAQSAAAHYRPGAGRWLERDPLLYTDGMQVYQYARSDPLGTIDSDGRQSSTQPSPPPQTPGNGSKVAVECAGVPYDVGIGTVTIAQHCSIVGSCNGVAGLRWEDAGARVQPGEGVEDKSGHPENLENNRKKERPLPDGYLDSDNGYPDKTGWLRYEVTCNKEQCECEIYNCLKEAIRRANLSTYHKTGPNSNTFAHALLEKCGCKMTKVVHVVSFWWGLDETSYADYVPEGAQGWNPDAWFDKVPDYWGDWKWPGCPCDASKEEPAGEKVTE